MSGSGLSTIFAQPTTYPTGTGLPWAGSPIQTIPIAQYATPGSVNGLVSAEEINFLWNAATKVALNVPTIAALKAIVPPNDGTGAIASVQSTGGQTDSLGTPVNGLYYWDVTNTFADNGLTTVAATSVSGAGRWRLVGPMASLELLDVTTETDGTTAYVVSVSSVGPTVTLPNAVLSGTWASFGLSPVVGDVVDYELVAQINAGGSNVGQIQIYENSTVFNSYAYQVGGASQQVFIRHRHVVNSTDVTNGGIAISCKGSSTAGGSVIFTTVSSRIRIRRP